MSAEKKDNSPTDKMDDELAALLDSTLEDFKKTEVAKKDETKTESTSKEVSTSSAEQITAEEWSSAFIQNTASQFEANLASAMAEGGVLTPELLQEKLQQMAEEAEQILKNPTQVSDESVDFGASIAKALRGLNDSSQALEPKLDEEDFMKMFAPGGFGQENEMMPFLQGMIQGLLSKELLAPSLQDFVEKLPDYIEKNRATLAKEDIERYENQSKLMEEVLAELNTEKDTDSPEVKKTRFAKVLGLMQKLQTYGQPPVELTGPADSPFNFTGAPENAEATPDCSVM